MIPKQTDDQIELIVHVQKLKPFFILHYNGYVFILHYNGYDQHINKEDLGDWRVGEWELAF